MPDAAYWVNEWSPPGSDTPTILLQRDWYAFLMTSFRRPLHIRKSRQIKKEEKWTKLKRKGIANAAEATSHLEMRHKEKLNLRLLIWTKKQRLTRCVVACVRCETGWRMWFLAAHRAPRTNLHQYTHYVLCPVKEEQQGHSRVRKHSGRTRGVPRRVRGLKPMTPPQRLSPLQHPGSLDFWIILCYTGQSSTEVNFVAENLFHCWKVCVKRDYPSVTLGPPDPFTVLEHWRGHDTWQGNQQALYSWWVDSDSQKWVALPPELDSPWLHALCETWFSHWWPGHSAHSQFLRYTLGYSPWVGHLVFQIWECLSARWSSNSHFW